ATRHARTRQKKKSRSEQSRSTASAGSTSRARRCAARIENICQTSLSASNRSRRSPSVWTTRTMPQPWSSRKLVLAFERAILSRSAISAASSGFSERYSSAWICETVRLIPQRWPSSPQWRMKLRAASDWTVGIVISVLTETTMFPARLRPGARAPGGLLPAVRHEQIAHVVRVLFFHREDLLEHGARRGVAVAEEMDQLAVVLDRDALGDQVFLDHPDQVEVAGTVLRRGARREPFGIEVRRAAELVDALGDAFGVLALFGGVLRELALGTLARDARRGDAVHRVPQHAHELGGERVLEQVDRLFGIEPVILRERAFVDLLAGAAAQLLDVGQERLLGVRRGHNSGSPGSIGTVRSGLYPPGARPRQARRPRAPARGSPAAREVRGHETRRPRGDPQDVQALHQRGVRAQRVGAQRPDRRRERRARLAQGRPGRRRRGARRAREVRR